MSLSFESNTISKYKIVENDAWNDCFNLLLDPSVSEIEANGPDKFFMKKNGRRIHISHINMTEKQYNEALEETMKNKKVMRAYGEFSWDVSLFEGILMYNVPDAKTRVRARCHVVLPPAATYAPQVTIAKKSISLSTLDSIAGQGSMSTEMKNFLECAVASDLTVVFSGGTGAGKTTMMEAVTKIIDPEYRIGIAEDLPELELIQPNVSYLKSVPYSPGMDVNNVVTLEWVIQQFQRMRTDKLLVGEIRGKEFSSFLIAANSGMDGSMTTMHADNPRACLTKMSEFTSAGRPGSNIRMVNQSIGASVDIIVQLVKHKDKHRVSHIEEVLRGVGQGEDAKMTSSTLYQWDEEKDVFLKKSQFSDELREKLQKKSADIQQFLDSAPNVPQPAHMSRPTHYDPASAHKTSTPLSNIGSNPFKTGGSGRTI